VYGGSSQDLVLLLERTRPFLQGSHLGALGLVETGSISIFDIRSFQPVVQCRLRDPEVSGNLAERRIVFSGHSHDIIAELPG
jgi:hypothetical protein